MFEYIHNHHHSKFLLASKNQLSSEHKLKKEQDALKDVQESNLNLLTGSSYGVKIRSIFKWRD